MKKYGIAIHGGAGMFSKENLSESKYQETTKALKEAYSIGFSCLENNKSSIEAVKLAVKFLEDSKLFNAGKGSVYNHEGKVEMDAAIMNGENLEAGAVASVSNVKNPIDLAFCVMKNTKHVLVSGQKAFELAKKFNLKIESEEYFQHDFRHQQWLKVKAKDDFILDHTQDKFGTVGAVAIDRKGNLASATSTGGMVNKKYGRIGDSPLIGAGTYANNKSCAISCTGHGEFFIRNVVAFDISARMLYTGKTLKECTEQVILLDLKQKNAQGGVIAIDKNGNISIPFNTTAMYRGFKSSSGEELAEVF